ECAQAPLLSPVAEQAVAFAACALLDCGLGMLIPAGGQDGVRNAEPLAKVRDHLRLGPALGAECMVDGGGLDEARPSGGGKQQQCKAVRTARNRTSDSRIGRTQRAEATGEAHY